MMNVSESQKLTDRIYIVDAATDGQAGRFRNPYLWFNFADVMLPKLDGIRLLPAATLPWSSHANLPS